MPTYRVEVWPARTPDDTTHEYRSRDPIATGRLYFLRGQYLDQPSVQRLCRELLADPVTERYEISDVRGQIADQSLTAPRSSLSAFIEVTLLPGVTDSAAENLVRAAHLLIPDTLEQAATGARYLLDGALSEAELHQLALDRFANPVIQRFTVNVPIEPPLLDAAQLAAVPTGQVETIALKEADDAALLAISKIRRLALDLAEMQAIRAYYQQENREPTDVELEMLAQTWSEHCVHKTFKALIEIVGEGGMGNGNNDPLPHSPFPSAQINGLLKTYIRAATEKVNKPWVRSAFVDNAGIIEFDDQWDLAFKVETHNHPSALEPFGGANTGVGGVIRDVLGVSARPIANTDVLCFGPLEGDRGQTSEVRLPEGVLPPQRVHDGVIKGVEDYGNKMGIPTVNGAILFHRGYTANPLVFCGCLGIVPASPNNAEPRKAQDGDFIVAMGGRTGRDGLRGATFSSMEMDTASSVVAGSAVQIGHPIHEKQTQEALLQARDLGLYSAITDCGAGGFSSAVGEMASGLGATVQLQAALLKYPGLQPWEIWLSEAQERLVLAVPPANWPQLKAVCDGQDIEAFVLGTFEASGRVKLCYGDKVVGDLSVDFLHEGIPQRRLKAAGMKRLAVSDPPSTASRQPPAANHTASLLTLLAHPNIRSKEDVVRKYDHEVKGQTAVKPFVGVAGHGPSDAAVLVIDHAQIANGAWASRQPPAAIKGITLSNGICPQYGELDPYAMAWAAIDEAVRNAVAVGTDPDRIAILDNFCWGNPNVPDRLGSLVECARGCYDAAVAYGTPFISGKDSLNNEYADADGTRHAIPGTLLISALGIVPDVNFTTTMDLKAEGNFLFVVGDTRAELGGAHYAAGDGVHLAGGLHLPPQPVPDALDRMRALHKAIAAGLVAACHDCSEGGLGVAMAEMCLAGRLGAEVNLARVPVGVEDNGRRGSEAGTTDDVILFSESSCRFIVEVSPQHVEAFEQALQGVPCAEVGRVWDDSILRIRGLDGEMAVWADVAELERAWRGKDAETTDGGRQTTVQMSSVVRRPSSPVSPSTQKKVLILHANGSNRDHDAAAAIELAGGNPEIVHVNQLFSRARNLLDYHMLVVPGGFAYGDDLGSGVLWALDLRARLGDVLGQFVASGRPVLGICNGFQTLVKAGLLPGWGSSGKETTDDRRPTALNPSSVVGRPSFLPRDSTLTFNQSGHFECRWVQLEANPNSACLFTQGLDELIYCPVAHGEGRFVTQDESALAHLKDNNLIALTYVGEGYPSNPNGSVANIAGICNAAGNVMGLMPHPENHIFPWQHPRWHRGERGQTGLGLFENGLKSR